MAQKRLERPVGRGAPDKLGDVSGKTRDTANRRPLQGGGARSAGSSATHSCQDLNTAQRSPQARQSTSHNPDLGTGASASPWARPDALKSSPRARDPRKRPRMIVRAPGTPDRLKLDWIIPPAVMRRPDVMMLAADALGPNVDSPRGRFAAQVITETADLSRRLVERRAFCRCVACVRPFGPGGAAAFLVGVPAAEVEVWPLCEACEGQDDAETIRQADAALARAYHGEDQP